MPISSQLRKQTPGSRSRGVPRSPPVPRSTFADLQSSARLPSGILCLVCAQGEVEAVRVALNSHSQAPHGAGVAVPALLPRSLTAGAPALRPTPAGPVLPQHPRDAPHSARLHPGAPAPGWVSEQPDGLTGNREKPGFHRAPRQSREEVRGRDGNVRPRQCLPIAH